MGCQICVTSAQSLANSGMPNLAAIVGVSAQTWPVMGFMNSVKTVTKAARSTLLSYSSASSADSRWAHIRKERRVGKFRPHALLGLGARDGLPTGFEILAEQSNNMCGIEILEI